ncbi:MAG: phosphoglycerate kinase [Planctomycetes bacterium]|nr:phosphoglycerate kinase [Planctomycetota bacterium]
MDYGTIKGVEALGNLAGKRVLVRADFNVPIEGGRITSDLRITSALPTIRKLQDAGARVVLCSHLGRPKGTGPEPKYSLGPVAQRLSELLGFTVPLLPDCVGEHIRADIDKLINGRAVLLENLRFHGEEQEGHEGFGRALSSLADAYVNDAFGTCHRGDASMTWPARLLPSAVGALVKQELDAMSRLLLKPAKPCLAVLGGAKISDKIPLVNNLLARVNELCIGGGMAYTFLKAQGAKVGKSLVDDTKVDACKAMLQKARELDVVIHLPKDHIVARSMDDETAHEVTGDIPDDQAGFDIGPKTAQSFAAAISRARTILFNGPMGVFVKSRFRNGTQIVVTAIGDSTAKGAFSLIGGGDSAAAVESFGAEKRMSHVSTGGGASLTLLQGDPMPALDALLQGKK